MKRLRDIGEDALIRRLVGHVPVPGDPAEGPGDDCAVLDPGRGDLLLLKTDALVENVHFLPNTPPRKVGWKAAARVVSDFAAMGGMPDRFLVTVAVDSDRTVSWLENVYKGLGDCLREYGGVLAGGETSRVGAGCGAMISVAATGRVKRGRAVFRDGGRAGDILLVTGSLGGSLRGRHLDFKPRAKEGVWLAERRLVASMMDVSDGLAKDLPRLAEASGCGFELDRERVPKQRGCSLEQALGDGEDFELLFSVRPAKLAELLAAWPLAFPKLRLSVIGRLTARGEGTSLEGGWDHFG